MSRRGSVKGTKSPLRVQSSSFLNFFKFRKLDVSVSKKLFRHADNARAAIGRPGVVLVKSDQYSFADEPLGREKGDNAPPLRLIKRFLKRSRFRKRTVSGAKRRFNMLRGPAMPALGFYSAEMR